MIFCVFTLQVAVVISFFNLPVGHYDSLQELPCESLSHYILMWLCLMQVCHPGLLDLDTCSFSSHWLLHHGWMASTLFLVESALAWESSRGWEMCRQMHMTDPPLKFAS